MGLAPGELLYPGKMYFVPCIPHEGGDFLTIYKKNTGDTNLKNLWCPGHEPDVWRREHFPTLDYYVVKGE